MKILVLAEIDNDTVNDATAATVTAAWQLGDDVTVLVAGSADAGANASQLAGVTKVIVADDPAFAQPLAEDIAKLVVDIAPEYSHILAPATTFGKNCLPRVAAKLDVAQISDVTAVIAADTFERPIYAGNAIATVQSSDTKKVITVRPTAFAQAERGEQAATIETLTVTIDNTTSTFVAQQTSDSDRPDLGSAKIVISGGRGLQNAENFQIIERLADRLGAAVGASRAAVDAGFVPNEYQVGQTGRVVAPSLYVAIGISGAIQHVAGIKDSQIIVAINKDPDAPIFEVADYGLVGDFFALLPELETQLTALGY